LPSFWKAHGGVFCPMQSAEAMWLHAGNHGYPIAIKNAADKINAATDEP
jgi:hypothetical protein